MEEQNSQTAPEQTAPDAPQAGQPEPVNEDGKKKSPNKTASIVVIILLLIAAGAAAYFLLFKKDESEPAKTADTSQAQQASGSEVASDELPAIDCEDGYSVFADKEFGAAFCYPDDWGAAAVEDAKLEADDTGNRQVIKFSRQPQIIVGGVSDDWNTSLGRGGGCLEPSNQLLAASDYNVEWHDITEDFAKRSMETSVGGYDLTEMVGTFDNGVCAVGHKVIDGSRYRVVSASYFAEFTTAVASADDHIYNSYELFRETERFELDKLLASLEAY